MFLYPNLVSEHYVVFMQLCGNIKWKKKTLNMSQQEFLIERHLGAFTHVPIGFPYISWEFWWKVLAHFLDPLVLHPLPVSEFLAPDFAQLCPSQSFEQGFWVDLIHLESWSARSPPQHTLWLLPPMPDSKCGRRPLTWHFPRLKPSAVSAQRSHLGRGRL